jgi:hypothetical protein
MSVTAEVGTSAPLRERMMAFYINYNLVGKRCSAMTNAGVSTAPALCNSMDCYKKARGARAEPLLSPSIWPSLSTNWTNTKT